MHILLYASINIMNKIKSKQNLTNQDVIIMPNSEGATVFLNV